MKQLTIFAFLLCGIMPYTIAQVNFNASDYPSIGDEFSIITYTNNPDAETVFMSDFQDTDMMFESVSMFQEYTIDTVRFLNPQDFDTEEAFTDATHLLRNGNMDYFITKSDESAEAIGFAGDQFQMGMNFPIRADNPLTLMEFPTTSETSFTDETSGETAMPVSALESVIPADYYSTFASMFDSLKIMLSVETSNEIIDVQDVVISLGSVNNGTHSCLKEFEESVTVVDIYVRSSWTGAWSPLSSVPGIGESLPMDLPYTDSTFTCRWWTPELGWPLVEIETDQTQDTVFNLKFHYNGLNSITSKEMVLISVHPNPATEFVNINIPSSAKKSGTINIISPEGKNLKTIVLTENIYKLSTKDLSNGWYIICLKDQDGKPIAYQKLVVNHN